MQTGWQKTFQLIAVVSSSFVIGMYLTRFISGKWDGGDLAALFGCGVSLVVFSILLLVGFWTNK